MFKDDVTLLQQFLNKKASPKLVEDGDPGPLTIGETLKQFKVEVPKTIEAPTTGFSGLALAGIAEREANRKLVWAAGSEATKYTDIFKSVFGSGRYAWCAAFVTWCCRNSGLNIPIRAPGTGAYTFALVEAWQTWFQKNGFYYDNDGKFVPQAGDIVMFDWDQKSINEIDNDWEDHIGIFLRMDGQYYICAEGNTGNATAVKKRVAVNIQGFGRIPDGYKFA